MAGTAGRFGARYGRRTRSQISLVEAKQKAKQLCQMCGAISVRRVSLGVFECKKCHNKFTGGAYTP